MKIQKKAGNLTITPECELVASKVVELRDAILTRLKKEDDIKHVKFNAQGISVVDSLGVNLIIGTYRECESRSLSFEVINANDQFAKVSDFFHFKNFFKVTPEQNKK